MIQPDEGGSTQGYPLDNVEVLRFDTSAGNSVKEILLKLNIPDHRSLKFTRWQSLQDGETRLCLVDDLKAPPSPNYVPGPEKLEQAPPSPEFIPGLVYSKIMPSEDEVFPAEEQPLPGAVSPTTDSPRYIADSDPEEDREDPEEDPKEDPIDYSADRGDDDDDDDESSDDDEDDDDG
ncbi:hypothetical protein Tco_1410480 [Tanacetum coccineum]